MTTTDAPATELDRALAVPGTVVHDEVIRARAPWSHVVRAGQTMRIVDLEGNQAVDCVLYVADDPTERYSAPDTIVGQRNVYLGAGTVLRTTEGRALMTVTGTTCERHDTLGG